MKKLFALVLCVVLALGCASAQAMTAGTYTGTGTGMKGEIAVDVTVTEDKIENIAVTAQQETYGIGYGIDAAPVESIPAWIVENQSLAADVVSGATITSRAILSAVEAALTEAGADAEALKAKTVEAAPADQVLECDVVVAGAGAAGLGAAVAAAEKGASVILLEKAGVTGGSTTRSGGYFIASGTSLQKASGIEDSNDDFFAFYKEIGGDLIDDVKVRDFVDNSAACYEWLVSNGAQFDSVTTVHPTHTVLRVHNSLGGQFMGTGQGGQMTAPMTNSFLAKGGTILYNAAADGLVLDADGNVAGLTATMNDGSKLTVNAKAVVLATGGFAGDKELVAKFPSNPANYSVPVTVTGDASKIVEAVDGKVEWNFDAANITMVSFTCGVGCYGEASGMIVGEKGNRVSNEYSYFYEYTEALIQDGSTFGWYITDADDPNGTAQYGMMLESTPHAATAAELAELIGADAETLTAAVERYNALCAVGEDADFGKPAEFLNALDKELYAIKLSPSISGTYGGVMTDVESQVINNAGEIIPGLYAAGEAAFCGLVGSEYPVCGTAIGMSFYFGQVAGENAAAFAAK